MKYSSSESILLGTFLSESDSTHSKSPGFCLFFVYFLFIFCLFSFIFLVISCLFLLFFMKYFLDGF